MAIAHEPYCDEDHLPRQRCNRALAPEGDPVAAFDIDPVEVPPPAPEIEPEQEVVEPASSTLRDAVALEPMPHASPWVARALDERTQPLQPPTYLASNGEHARDVVVDKGRGVLGKLFVVGGVLAAVGIIAD